VTNTLCELCKERDKTPNYLFFEFKIAKDLCSKCDSWVDVSSVSHSQLMAHFQQFHCMDLSNSQNIYWKGMWLAIIWGIWALRNKVIFNQGKVDL